MDKYILAIDQGTTSSRAIIFDAEARIVASAAVEVAITARHSGWVEQDGREIWESVVSAVDSVLKQAQLAPEALAALGITNQRETTLVWDETGHVLAPAIVWQSRQSAPECAALIARGLAPLVAEKTGLVINPYFSASKLLHLLGEQPRLGRKLLAGKVYWGTVDTYLIYKLTGGAVYATDHTNASRTLLYNLRTGTWDEELLAAFGLEGIKLPKILASNALFGRATALSGLRLENLPITGVAGDQQAALFGQCAYSLGAVKATYGTGAFILQNTGEKIPEDRHGLLATVAYALEGAPRRFALEGAVFVAGSAVQWLRDGMRFFKESGDCELAAAGGFTTGGVYVVPAFTGLGAPYWDNACRGAVFGLTRATRREEFINATVQAIAYQAGDIFRLLEEVSGAAPPEVYVDGGASVNDYLLQFQADISQVLLKRPDCLESTALGAAFLAGLGAKVFPDLAALVRLHRVNRVFTPKISAEQAAQLTARWQQAVAAARMFKEENQ